MEPGLGGNHGKFAMMTVVSDSKFGWGKIYGQWICGAVIVAYDVEGRFDPHHLLTTLERLRPDENPNFAASRRKSRNPSGISPPTTATWDPDKPALVWVDGGHHEKRLSFGDLSRLSSQAACFYQSLGIQKGGEPHRPADRALSMRGHWIEKCAVPRLEQEFPISRQTTG